MKPRWKVPVKLEKHEQDGGVKLLRSIGAVVYEIGTRRRKGKPCPKCRAFVPNDDFGTHQTPGIPDVLAFLPARDNVREVLWWEAKREKGSHFRKEQKEFREFVLMTSTWHCVGALDELLAWLLEHRYLAISQIPHYRIPKRFQQQEG